MTELTLYIGKNLDGYIADVNDGVEWMTGDGSHPDHLGSYDAFLATIDTIIMGRRTYDQIHNVLAKEIWPYPD